MKQNYLKRFFSLHKALILALFAQLFSLTMMAEEIIVDGIKYNAVKKAKQATVIANSPYNMYYGNVVIPSSFIYGKCGI